MAEEIEKLSEGITLSDDNFGMEEFDFAETLLSDTKVPLEDIEEAKKKEEEEKKKNLEKAKLEAKKTPEKKDLNPEDLLGEDKEPEDKETLEEEDDDIEGNQFENISKGLVKLGIFSEDGDLPKTGEEFAARFEQEKQEGASAWINNFLSSEHGEEGINLFKAIFVDKVDPREYFSVHNENLQLKDLDMDNDLNQKKVYREFYKRLNWDETKIEAKLQKSIDYGDLESDSKEFYDKLLEDNEKKLVELQETKKASQEKQLQEDADYKNSITKLLEDKLKTREFNGIPLNPETVKKVVDFMTTKKYQTPDKQKLTEYDKFILESRKPENLNSRILHALLALNNFNFDSIKKRAVTSETDEVFAELKGKTKASAKSAKSNNDWFANSL